MLPYLCVFKIKSCIYLLCLIIACLPGTYGDQCEQECICEENQPCYHVTGACHCPPGYKGPACEQRKHS